MKRLAAIAAFKLSYFLRTRVDETLFRRYSRLISHRASLVALPPPCSAAATMSAAGVHWTQALGMPSPLMGLVRQAASPMHKNPSVTRGKCRKAPIILKNPAAF